MTLPLMVDFLLSVPLVTAINGNIDIGFDQYVPLANGISIRLRISGRALFGHVGICQFEVSAVVFVQPGPGLIARH